MLTRPAFLGAIAGLIAATTNSFGAGIEVRREGDRVAITWPIAGAEFGRLVLNPRQDRPLIESLGIAPTADGPATELFRDVGPEIFLTVGERSAPKDHPPGMSVFNIFFDNPPTRPFQTFRSQLKPKLGRISPGVGRIVIGVEGLTVGSFAGEWQFTVYEGSRLVQVEAVIKTSRRSPRHRL